MNKKMMEKLMTAMAVACMLAVSCATDNENEKSDRSLTFRLTKIPETIQWMETAVNVGAVALFSENLNECDIAKINGNSSFIAEVKNGVAEWKFNYSFNVDWIAFQFVPMTDKNAVFEESDQWWQYAISGDSNYYIDYNNIICELSVNNATSGDVVIEVSPESYLGTPSWQIFPVYKNIFARLHTSNHKGCYTVNGKAAVVSDSDPNPPPAAKEYKESDLDGKELYFAGANGGHWGFGTNDAPLKMNNSGDIWTVTFKAEAANPTPWGCKMTAYEVGDDKVTGDWLVEYVLESSLPSSQNYSAGVHKTFAASGEKYKFAFLSESAKNTAEDDNTKLYLKYQVEVGADITFTFDKSTHEGWYTYTATNVEITE